MNTKTVPLEKITDLSLLHWQGCKMLREETVTEKLILPKETARNEGSVYIRRGQLEHVAKKSPIWSYLNLSRFSK
jgi:hypothetical protein